MSFGLKKEEIVVSEAINQRLREIIPSLYENAAAFRQRMDDAGLTPADIQTVDSLAKLPVLRKYDLIELQRQNPPFGGLMAAPMSQVNRVFQSPGPINEASFKIPDPGRWSPSLEAAGFQEGDIVLNAFGYHLTPAGASLEDALFAMNCIVIPGGIGNQEQQIQAILSLNATGYVGLPSYLKVLLEKAKALGHTLPLKRAFVMAEPLPSSLRQELQSYGIDVFQSYGVAECGNLGYECDEIDGWHIPDGVVVQICDSVTGEPLPHGTQGEVVATVLSNHYAIIRFGVGDLSSFNDAPCPCGRSSHRLNGWQGRVGEATKIRGLFFYPSQLAGLMAARFPEVTAFQAVITRQDHVDHLAVHIALKEGVSADEVSQRLQDIARQALKFRIEVKHVDAATLPSGTPIWRDERSWD